MNSKTPHLIPQISNRATHSRSRYTSNTYYHGFPGKGKRKMDEFRQGIIKMINEIEDINMLEYLHEFIRLQMEREE